MPPVKSRREMYAEATRAAILEQAAELFVQRGFAGTSLEDVAKASQVTRGAVYHHFSGKQALFEAVLDAQELHMVERVAEAIGRHDDPWDGSLAAIEAFLEQCLDPTYSRLVWREGPAALGWARWKECEEKYAFGLIEVSARALVAAGYLDGTAMDTLIRFVFQMFGAAGMALADADEDDKPRVRDECSELIRRMLTGLRVRPE